MVARSASVRCAGGGASARPAFLSFSAAAVRVATAAEMLAGDADGGWCRQLERRRGLQLELHGARLSLLKRSPADGSGVPSSVRGPPSGGRFGRREDLLGHTPLARLTDLVLRSGVASEGDASELFSAALTREQPLWLFGARRVAHPGTIRSRPSTWGVASKLSWRSSTSSELKTRARITRRPLEKSHPSSSENCR